MFSAGCFFIGKCESDWSADETLKLCNLHMVKRFKNKINCEKKQKLRKNKQMREKQRIMEILTGKETENRL